MPIFEITAPAYHAVGANVTNRVLRIQSPNLRELTKAIGTVPAVQAIGLPSLVPVEKKNVDFVLSTVPKMLNASIRAGKAIRQRLQEMSSDPLMLIQHQLLDDGVFDYCGQVCGGGLCGTRSICQNGIDPDTHFPGRPCFDINPTSL